jgi:hypothetical protein
MKTFPSLIILASPIAAPTTISSLAPSATAKQFDFMACLFHKKCDWSWKKTAADDSSSSHESGGKPVVEKRDAQINMDDLFGEKCEFVMTPGFPCD